MSDLHIRRIKTVLHKEFDGLIDLSDLAKKSKEILESNFLTRSQAALVLSNVAEIDANTAASYVIDAFEDNGIDAIYFDEIGKVIYVIQSKWVESGDKGPDAGSTQKFISGFRDFIGGRFERFNAKFAKHKDQLESALLNPEATFSLIIVYTGTQPVSTHVKQIFDDLVKEQNDPTPIVSYRSFSQKDIYNALSGSLENESINIDVTLYDWGQIREPYQAYYGQVGAEEIAGWHQEHKTRLTSRNLRNFKGDTEVNDAMKSTLVQDSGKFWYFNNGITILCNKITKKPIGGSSRDTGQFICEGVSVVNGAQTVGSIANAVSQGFPKAKNAKVLVRFISLENCPPDFGIEVTTATNTQNRIERRDFASLDATQERLRNELFLDLEKFYVYKTGEKVSSYQDGCDIEEATVALACSYPKIQLAAGAKRNIGMLWGDITKPPYILLFNEKLTALRLWHCVQIGRIVENALANEQRSANGNRTRIIVHGNRFILHRVFQLLHQSEFDNIKFDVENIKITIIEKTKEVLDQITKIVDEAYGDFYLNSFFKSGSKCEELNNRLPQLPPVPQIPYFDGLDDKDGQLLLPF